MGLEKLRALRWEAALTLTFLASAILTLTLIAGSAFSSGAGGNPDGARPPRGVLSNDMFGNTGITATRSVAPSPGSSYPSSGSSIHPGAPSQSPRDASVQQIPLHARQQSI